jgi:hypothetical protein
MLHELDHWVVRFSIDALEWRGTWDMCWHAGGVLERQSCADARGNVDEEILLLFALLIAAYHIISNESRGSAR